MTILITGASGFVGKALDSACGARGHEVVHIIRKKVTRSNVSTFQIDLSERGRSEQWQDAMLGIDVVVHLAGVAHTDYTESKEAESFYHRHNVIASENVITEAYRAGVQRFVYLSSVKAVAERSAISDDGMPIALSDNQVAHPEDIYGKSKYLAECRLTELAQELGMQLVIVRAPLVYGVGQKGNMAKLYRTVKKSIPLPFADVQNLRSMISVNNLCSAILSIVESNSRNSGAYFVSDVEISVTDLIRAIGVSVNKPARLFKLPLGGLERGFRLLGKQVMAEKLLGSLIVDSSNFRQRFGWMPMEDFVSVLEEIAEDLES
jgi:nucleoside-diphosphate-sugar epimerase